MATITPAVLAIPVTTLSTTVADRVTLTGTGHKLRIDNITGGSALYVNFGNTEGGATAQGTLTVDTNPTAGDTLTIGSKTYTFVSTLVDTDETDLITMNAGIAFTKAFIYNAITGVTGGNTIRTGPHPEVTAAEFSGDDMVITAILSGTGGNSIATTETFTAVTNVFDADTLGTTTAGAEDSPVTATAAADHHVVPPGSFIELSSQGYGLSRGVDLSIVGSGNSYCVQFLK